MLDEIKEVIRKNLPAEVGDQLRQRLDLIETLEYNAKKYLQQIENGEVDRLRLAARVESLEKDLKWQGLLDTREKELDKREAGMEVILARHDACHQESRVRDMKELVQSLFRGPRLDAFLTREEFNVVKDQWGNMNVIKAGEKRERTSNEEQPR